MGHGEDAGRLSHDRCEQSSESSHRDVFTTLQIVTPSGFETATEALIRAFKYSYCILASTSVSPFDFWRAGRSICHLDERVRDRVGRELASKYGLRRIIPTETRSHSSSLLHSTMAASLAMIKFRAHEDGQAYFAPIAADSMTALRLPESGAEVSAYGSVIDLQSDRNCTRRTVEKVRKA